MDLTDEQWALIEPRLPVPRVLGGRGRPHLEYRKVIDGILWKLRYNLSWRQLPSRYGSNEACFSYYNRWRRNNRMHEITDVLIKDVETRGKFNMEEGIKSGIVIFKENGSKWQVYILAPYTEMWQVSTAMLYYQKLAGMAGESYYQSLSE